MTISLSRGWPVFSSVFHDWSLDIKSSMTYIFLWSIYCGNYKLSLCLINHFHCHCHCHSLLDLLAAIVCSAFNIYHL